jgi:hypothetical protein
LIEIRQKQAWFNKYAYSGIYIDVLSPKLSANIGTVFLIKVLQLLLWGDKRPDVFLAKQIVFLIVDFDLR